MREENDFGTAATHITPTSTRRYPSISDVRAEVGRKQVDAQPVSAQRQYIAGNTHERRTTIPPRRTSTQSNLPVVQVSRQRHFYTDDVLPYSEVGGLLSRHPQHYH